MEPKILKFRAQFASGTREAMALHEGVNATTWMGKEPRSCRVTNIHSGWQTGDGSSPMTAEITVVYKPIGCVTFEGSTRYHGWQPMMLARNQAGELCDANGVKLRPDAQPIYVAATSVPVPEVEFANLNFGEFLGETDAPGIPKLKFSEVMATINAGGRFHAYINDSFVASRRQRPDTKIIIANHPSHSGQFTIVNTDTPQIEQILMDKVTEILSEFIEGRISIVTFGNEADILFVKMSDLIMDTTYSDEGFVWSDCLKTYVPITFMEELAKRLMAFYKVECSIVEGDELGLLIKQA
ncbi:MAG TPA: hypothetical protein VFE47_04340 [Tepidisphaeraceae bacterium]|jgi:hypothetical protein|nr:hypothetical protein [Tepidisphaeraceae bacterium]